MMVNNELYSIILPGRIVSFDESNQTATVQVSAQRTYSNSEVRFKEVDRKPLLDVPVHIPSGGGWSFTMPIAAGDTCLLMFSQVGYDHWFYEDKDKADSRANLPAPHLSRQFSEDDGFCLVGFNTLKRSIQSYSSTESEWRNDTGSQKITLKTDGSIEMLGDVTVTGDLLVTGNITNVRNDTHTHTSAAPGSPTGVPIYVP